jgi:hypothetical protein
MPGGSKIKHTLYNSTNNLYLSGANPGYEVRGEACDTFGQKKQQKRILRGGCMHATPPPDSAPVVLFSIFILQLQNNAR